MDFEFTHTLPAPPPAAGLPTGAEAAMRAAFVSGVGVFLFIQVLTPWWPEQAPFLVGPAKWVPSLHSAVNASAEVVAA